MHNDPQNGIDYLVDWYALLGVERTADAETIRRAYKEQQRKYHPDRYSGLATEFATQAAHRSVLLSEASSTLLDEAKRSAYDIQLTTWEGPVSTDGMAIIDFTRSRFSASRLLQPSDASASQKAWDKTILELSGFDPKTFALLERLAHMQDATPDMAEAYREALRRKQVFLQLEEVMLWDAAGFIQRSPEPQTPRAYLEHVELALTNARETVHREIAATLLALEGKDVKLLMGSEPLSTVTEQAVLAHQHEAAVKRFDTMSEAIRAKAAEEQAIIEKRLSFVRGEYPLDQPEHFPRLIVVVTVDDKLFTFSFRLAGERVVDDTVHDPEKLKHINESATITEFIAQGVNVMRFTFEPDIRLYDQLEAVLIAHFEMVSPTP